jgi:hypothetical protein
MSMVLAHSPDLSETVTGEQFGNNVHSYLPMVLAMQDKNFEPPGIISSAQCKNFCNLEQM